MSTTLPHGLITVGYTHKASNQSHDADVIFERSQVLHSFWKVHAVRHREPSNPSLAPDNEQTIQRSPASTSTALTRSTPSQYPTAAPQSRDRQTSITEIDGPEVAIEPDIKPPKSTRPSMSRAGSSGIRTSFAGTSSRMKGRPSISRRKSSQGACQNKPVKLSRVATQSPVLTSRDMEKVEEIPSAVTTSTFELPSASSWEDEPTMEPHRLATSTSYSGTPSELVEPNFRNKFAERIASSSNLAGMNRMKKTGSVVRFADDTPGDVKRAKNDAFGSTSSFESQADQSRRGSVASIAVIDEDESDTPPVELHRTKSQLSIMINESRSHQGRRTSEYIPSADQVGLSSRRKREPTDEEKVLAMAHREGVTRAGGRQIRRGFKLNDEDESRYSSPSPPPIF